MVLADDSTESSEFLTLLAVNIFFMVYGTNYVYAHELKQHEQERFLHNFSQTFGVPIERLIPDRPSLLDRFEGEVTDPLSSCAVAGSSQVERLIQELFEQLSDASILSVGARLHATSPQEPSGSGGSRQVSGLGSPESERDAQSADLPSRPISAGGKDQAGAASLREGGRLPLRRLEKKAATTKVLPAQRGHRRRCLAR